jgi:predicted unusual protein kinase regulating ubiquinone biosynthesis (AarF/ABC1/UbiB family)
MVQTDPNPGNFLITKNNQLALLDFGAVKIYERNFIEGYKKVLVAAFNDNQDELLAISHDLSFIDPREPEEVREIYLKMMQTLAAPFRSDDSFDFKDRNFFEESKNLSWELSRACRFSPPPKELLFLHRKLAGVFGLVKKLEVKVKLNTYRKMVENN